MRPINITDLNNAKLDVDHIAEIATSVGATATDRMGNVKPTVRGAVTSLAAFNARGAFVAGRAYAVKDVYTSSGIAYVALVEHTSAASVATDLAAGKVSIHQGATREELAAARGASLLGVIQSGVGAVAQTLEDALRDQVRVTQFMTLAERVDARTAAPVLDHSNALQAALNCGRANIVFPDGYTYRITRYLTVPSNTTVHFLGTLLILTKGASQPSGFDIDRADNVTIDGHGSGLITDPGVAANFVWNEEYKYAPCIHVRRSNNITVRNLRARHVVQGIWASAQTSAWYEDSGALVNGTQRCNLVRVENCHVSYSQVLAIGCNQVFNFTAENNYVFRAGDSGICIFNAEGVRIVGNTRESPYGDGGAIDKTDQQGISLENVYRGEVAGNTVVGMGVTGIDIKRGCDDIAVVGNTLKDIQCAPIAVRAGDMVTATNNRVDVRENSIIRLGFPHSSLYTNYAGGYPISGGIYAAECKQITIAGNRINGYQTYPAIKCVLPIGAFDFYHGKQNESYCDVRDNIISFVTDTGADALAQFDMTATTPAAIYIKGVYDRVVVEGNKVQGNRLLLSDTRRNDQAGVYAEADSTNYGGNAQYFPKTLQIHDNTILNWCGMGVRVEGKNKDFGGAYQVRGNSVTNVGHQGFRLINMLSPLISGNTVISGGGVGAPQTSMVVSNCPNAIISGNVLEKRTFPDADLGGNALEFIYSGTGLVAGNRINGTTDIASGNTGVVSVNNI